MLRSLSINVRRTIAAVAVRKEWRLYARMRGYGKIYAAPFRRCFDRCRYALAYYEYEIERWQRQTTKRDWQKRGGEE